MSGQPDRHLRPVEDAAEANLVVIDLTTGAQIAPLADYTQRLEDEVTALTRNLRAEGVRYENLKRDKEAEAEAAEVWPAAQRVFRYWRDQAGRSKRTIFTLDRFELIRPWLEKLGDPKASAEDRLKEAETLCMLAVDGIVFDHYEETRPNGSIRHHVGWHLIFDKAERFEDRCNSAPREKIAERIGNRTVKQAMAGKRPAAQTTLDQAQPEG